MSDTWDGNERRAYVKTIQDVEAAFNRAMHEHEARERENVEKLLDDLKEEAFPDGAQNHKAAHEAMIRAAQAQEMFWTELKLDIAKKGAWGMLTMLVGMAILGAAVKFGLAKP